MKIIEFIDRNRELFCCPKCTGDLCESISVLKCESCEEVYRISEGIPLLFWPSKFDEMKVDVTQRVRDFYEESPFPDYDEYDTIAVLREKARKSLFARLLDEQVPVGAKVLEIGCGTGQLISFLSLTNRTAIGIDLSVNSLKLGLEFKLKNDLGNVQFLHMNLFRPCFKKATFDLVIANGVLHHTSDPYLGFREIGSLVKPRGHILIGLYHKHGRLLTDARRIIFGVTKRRLLFLDRRAVDEDLSRTRREAWFKDQYENPYESKHTVKEVLQWLQQEGFELVKCIPKMVLGRSFDENERLFEKDEKISWPRLFVGEISMMIRGTREGGFFTIIALKK